MANSDNEEVFLFDKPLVYKDIENKFDRCYSLQKEISELKKEKEKLQTLNNDHLFFSPKIKSSYFVLPKSINPLINYSVPRNSSPTTIINSSLHHNHRKINS